MSDRTPTPPPGDDAHPSAVARTTSPLAILALVTGVVAFVLSVLPSVAVVAWPFAAAATVLGTVGILRAVHPHWMPPVGLALGATGRIVSVILVIVVIGG